MSRVKIEDLKPEARELNAKEMKKLFGGNLFSSDLAYLQGSYNQLNSNGAGSLQVVCPKSTNVFNVDVDESGGE